MEKKVAIMGNYNTILGFKAVGVNAFPVSDVDEAVQTLNKIKESDEYAIIFITEDWLEQLFKKKSVSQTRLSFSS